MSMENRGIQKNTNQKINKLIELNDELENYFRNTIIPQLFVDANLILRKYSPPAMKQFSLKKSHIGKSMEELIDNIRYSTIIENINEVIKNGEVFEKEIQTTDKRWFQMNILPYVVKKDNKTNGVIITFVDITDRIKSLKELERLNASHETFIYSVSHDLKGPLANIEGLVQLLTKSSDQITEGQGDDTKDHQFIVELLDQSVTSMKDIINELTDIVKIEANYKEQVETVSFAKILYEIEMMLKDKILEHHVKIRYDIQQQDIEFSRKNIRSILYNLISNAVKYHNPDVIPEVFVNIYKKKGMLHITVADNGMGIAEDQLELIFTPFTRLKKDIDGTGIGLHLVKKIIENEGGRISVSSKVGEGTRFDIYLDIKVEEL